MQIDRRTIESNLLKKGFVLREDAHHRYFHHVYHGEKTPAYAYISHGSRYKTYGMPLLKKMKMGLRLDTNKQVIDLIECPMSGEDYNQILKNKGLI